MSDVGAWAPPGLGEGELEARRYARAAAVVNEVASHGSRFIDFRVVASESCWRSAEGGRRSSEGSAAAARILSTHWIQSLPRQALGIAALVDHAHLLRRTHGRPAIFVPVSSATRPIRPEGWRVASSRSTRQEMPQAIDRAAVSSSSTVGNLPKPGSPSAEHSTLDQRTRPSRSKRNWPFSCPNCLSESLRSASVAWN